jgi:hypothetical protein
LLVQPRPHGTERLCPVCLARAAVPAWIRHIGTTENSADDRGAGILAGVLAVAMRTRTTLLQMFVYLMPNDEILRTGQQRLAWLPED